MMSNEGDDVKAATYHSSYAELRLKAFRLIATSAGAKRLHFLIAPLSDFLRLRDKTFPGSDTKITSSATPTKKAVAFTVGTTTGVITGFTALFQAGVSALMI